MLNSSYDKIGFNLKLERAFVFVLKNILGPSVVIHYDRDSAEYYYNQSQRCPDGRVVSGLSLRMRCD